MWEIKILSRLVKVKVWVLAIALLTWEDSWTAALYSLGSGSWLAWASGTTARYAAIHCGWRKTGPMVQHDRHTTTPISLTKPSPHSRRLLLINQPQRDGTLSWRWYTAATASRDLATTIEIPKQIHRTIHTVVVPTFHRAAEVYWLDFTAEHRQWRVVASEASDDVRATSDRPENNIGLDVGIDVVE